MVNQNQIYSSRIAISAVIAGGILFLGGFFIGGYQATSNLNAQTVTASTTADFAPFWKAWSVLNEKYVAADDIPSDQDKVWGAIEGLAAAYGDPYTTFFPPQEAKSFAEEISGTFEGVGMELGVKDGILTVVSPLKGNPAEKAGVKAGDKIVAINGTSTQGLANDEAVKIIRGPKGTPVTITVVREGATKPLDITIVRDTVIIPAIETELLEGNVFKISIYTFSAQSAEGFRNALREFVLSGTHKLIIDLRNNPGGYLDAAVDMASWFLPIGKPIVTEDFGSKSEQEGKVYRSKGYNAFSDKLQLVLLVNGGSASASEILAGALQDHGKATLIGEKTFGKGSVQELVPVTKDTSIKVTIARWLTPNGQSISKVGLTPDIEVKITEEDVLNKNDSQLKKALEVLGQKP